VLDTIHWNVKKQQSKDERMEESEIYCTKGPTKLDHECNISLTPDKIQRIAPIQMLSKLIVKSLMGNSRFHHYIKIKTQV